MHMVGSQSFCDVYSMETLQVFYVNAKQGMRIAC